MYKDLTRIMEGEEFKSALKASGVLAYTNCVETIIMICDNKFVTLTTDMSVEDTYTVADTISTTQWKTIYENYKSNLMFSLDESHSNLKSYWRDLYEKRNSNK